MPRADPGVLPRATLITRGLAVLLLLTFAPPARAVCGILGGTVLF
jgi:hypothetical protein